MYNDLEQAAFKLRPELSNVKQQLIEQGYPALLSGSGSSIFALLPDSDDAQHLLREMLPTGYRLLITRLASLRPAAPAGDEQSNTEL